MSQSAQIGSQQVKFNYNRHQMVTHPA